MNDTLDITLIRSYCLQELTMPALSPTMSHGNIAAWQVRVNGHILVIDIVPSLGSRP